jgi:hypothetical protein
MAPPTCSNHPGLNPQDDLLFSAGGKGPGQKSVETKWLEKTEKVTPPRILIYPEDLRWLPGDLLG